MRTVSTKSRIRGTGSRQRWTVPMSGQLTKEVRFKATFKGSYSSRSRVFIPYLGWPAAKGSQPYLVFMYVIWRRCWLKKHKSTSRPLRKQSVINISRLKC